MKIKLAVAAFMAALLLVCGSASGKWGGNCTILHHCYANVEWEPNVHRNITDTWGYITAEDVRWGNAQSEPNQDFVTMEMWMSWAVPGEIVGFKTGNQEWLEAGQVWEPEGANDGGGCHYFAAAQFAGGWFQYLNLAPCVTHTHALFKFVQSSDHQSQCAWWGDTQAACVPIVECETEETAEGIAGPCTEKIGALPHKPWTSVEGGMEISDEAEPEAMKGKGEFFALGGVNNWWQGKRKAEGFESRESTCIGKFGEGNPAKGKWAAGTDCPLSGRAKGKGGEYENPEEPFAQLPNEEGTEEPWCCAEPPTSTVDAFSNYAATGAVSQKSVEERAKHEAEALGGVNLESPTVRRPVLRNAGVSPRFAQASTPGQEAAEVEKTYVVEVEEKPVIHGRAWKPETCFPSCEYREEVTHEINEPTATFDGGETSPEINVVYSAKTGAVLERSYVANSPQIEARKKLRRLNWEIGWWLADKHQVNFCKNQNPKVKDCEEIVAKYEWAKHESIRKRAEEKQKRKEEKKAIAKREKEEKARAREEERAKVASLHSEPPKFGDPEEVPLIEINAPEEKAVIAVRRHGHMVTSHRRKLRTHLRRGTYYVTVRTPTRRCTRRVLIRRARHLTIRCG